ncbi:tRNA-dihydrouridine synthase B [Spiroplasma chinense]|uniref:tRNA-dihydrouridine synthase n=1 Tax=Spiroplasma chinense TaxID=216932 RepID=A0A5B9Y4N2_9MOLU|nr:tRNA dihydrouridine synthase DusB [Spiroplasma chinense]QEH61217.1 tRNA-dihydrouridine synthase B [Spiroplasma chinense]
MKIKNVDIKGKVFLGPMAGTTNAAFRIICKEKGASLVYAEMVSTEGLVHNNKKTKTMIEVSDLEHPISLQIFGFDANSFVQAAKIVEEFSECDIIDINMGCPAPKVALRSQAGANLLKHPQRVGEVIKAVVDNTSKPVTVKMRIGWDEDNKNVVELAKIAEANGASAIAIHARTRTQFYTGKADWTWIKKVKEAVKIPVIGNGDVVDGPTAKKMLDETGCDAIMVARAAQGNPWIFREIQHYLDTGEELEKPSYEEWKETILRHSDLLIEMRGEEFAMREMRKQMLWYIAVLGRTPKTLEMKRYATELQTINDIKNIFEIYEKN